MLKLSVLEFFFRGIPESFLLLFSTYAFSKAVINKGRYVLSSILSAVIIYIIRCLPINLGVHTVFAIITTIVLNVFINKFHVIKAIKSTIIAFTLVFICETLNIIVIQNILGLDMNNAFRNDISRLLYSSPSLIIFALIVIGYYFVLLKRKELRVHK